MNLKSPKLIINVYYLSIDTVNYLISVKIFVYQLCVVWINSGILFSYTIYLSFGGLKLGVNNNNIFQFNWKCVDWLPKESQRSLKIEDQNIRPESQIFHDANAWQLCGKLRMGNFTPPYSPHTWRLILITSYSEQPCKICPIRNTLHFAVSFQMKSINCQKNMGNTLNIDCKTNF